MRIAPVPFLKGVDLIVLVMHHVLACLRNMNLVFAPIRPTPTEIIPNL